jgi:tRNA(fMet)-specific endonuclease VapC
MDYLLDTNIVLIYLRGAETADKIEDDLRLFSSGNNVAISVVTIGELRSIAKQRGYGENKTKKLEKLLRSLAIIDINIEEVIERYAEIDTYSQGRLPEKPLAFTARNMGKNDLWIAATASAYDLTLISTDQDFNHLDDEFLRLKQVDLSNHKV